jgi:hypothetical protein
MFWVQKVLSSKHPFNVTMLVYFHLSLLLHLLFLPHSCSLYIKAFFLCLCFHYINDILKIFMFFYYINGIFFLLQGPLWTKEKRYILTVMNHVSLFPIPWHVLEQKFFCTNLSRIHNILQWQLESKIQSPLLKWFWVHSHKYLQF